MSILSLIDLLQIPVAAIDAEALEKSAKARNGSLADVGGCDRANVLQVRGPDGGAKEVWVRPAYSGYREAWSKVFGSPADFASVWARATGNSWQGKQIDLDHVLARSVGERLGYGYLRLFPVVGDVNQHSGRSLEKTVAANTSLGNRGARPMHQNGIETLDILGLGKVLGFSLIHAQYSGSITGSIHDRNMDFLRQWSNDAKTIQVLKEIGFYWWQI